MFLTILLPDLYNHINYHLHTLIRHRVFKNKRLLQEKQEYFYSKENSVTAPPQAAYFTAGGIIGSLLGTIIEAVMRGIL